ncbi:hypothetical protein [Lichenihabitans psoromatis]|uniref:hypothetical protein n=1 Tax=Lichenihabitans psoromatis TaxID=2528642 RepID=UPI0010385335|nr:hypothetical protein [Lichenihabitans psoromatis]
MASLEEDIQSHATAIRYLLDAQVASSGRAKADALVIRKLIEVLSDAGLLDRVPFEDCLKDAIAAAKRIPTTDPVQVDVWAAFSERLREIVESSDVARILQFSKGFNS